MKTRKWIAFLLMLCILAACLIPASAVSPDEIFRTPVKAAMLIELNSDTVLFSLDENEQNYPASLTKIMTCLLALELGNLEDIVTVSAAALENLDINGSTANLKQGEQMSLLDMLYCVMVSSANEACNVVAEHISGSVEAFVDLMNQRAAELGCTGTHFANPHGLHDENHYTTAYDLSLITREALKNETFCAIVNTPSYTVPATNLSDARKLVTTNYLITPGHEFSYSKAAGVKTGFTSPAKRCLISTADNGDLRLLGIIMGAETVDDGAGGWVMRNFPECINLFEWGFNTYTFATVLNTLYPIAEVQVNQSSGAQTVALAPAEALRTLVSAEYDPEAVELDIQLHSETVDAPIEAGQVLGTVTVSFQGEVLGSCDLAAITGVSRSEITHQVEETQNYVEDNWWKWLVGILLGIIVLIIAYIIFMQFYRRQQRRRKVAARRRALELQRRRQEWNLPDSDERE